MGRYIHLTGLADAGPLTGNRKGREVTMDIKKIALFAAGTLFGSAGFKLLSSKDAKKVYTQTTAAVLRMKDSTMETVSKVQEQAGDILADAKAINEARAVEAEAAVAAGDKAAANEALPVAIAEIEKAASKGIFHKNAAARKVSHITKAVNAMA